LADAGGVEGIFDGLEDRRVGVWSAPLDAIEPDSAAI